MDLIVCYIFISCLCFFIELCFPQNAVHTYMAVGWTAAGVASELVGDHLTPLFTHHLWTDGTWRGTSTQAGVLRHEVISVSGAAAVPEECACAARGTVVPAIEALIARTRIRAQETDIGRRRRRRKRRRRGWR